MTAEELSKALYEKLMQEQEQYAEWLKTQPPDVILKLNRKDHCTDRQEERGPEISLQGRKAASDRENRPPETGGGRKTRPHMGIF